MNTSLVIKISVANENYRFLFSWLINDCHQKCVSSMIG
jgi:hypothetical protein